MLFPGSQLCDFLAGFRERHGGTILLAFKNRWSVLAAAALVMSFVPLAPEQTAVAVPTEQTVVVLSSPLGLSAAGRAIGKISPSVLALEQASPIRGGFVAHFPMPIADAVAHYRADYASRRSGEPEIFAVRVPGNVPRSVVEAAMPTASYGVAPISATIVMTPASHGARIVAFRRSASRAMPRPPGLLSPDPTTRPWAPTRGKINAYNTTSAPYLIVFTSERGEMDHELTWDTQAEIDAFGDYAYEHDFKIWNDSNWSLPTRPFCPLAQNDAFWVKRSPITFESWEASFPAATEPYVDTDVSDTCQTQDFTVGLLAPRNLSPGVVYTIRVIALRGVEPSSPMTLIGQVITKLPGCGDAFAACAVNAVDSTFFVARGESNAPGCRLWTKTFGQPSTPC